MKADAGERPPETNESAIPAAIPVSVILSGRIWNSASIASSARQADERKAPDAISAQSRPLSATRTQSAPFASSIAG